MSAKRNKRIVSVRVCKYCGKQFATKTQRQYCGRECAAMAKGSHTKDTICWECKKSTNDECSWSKDFTPVEGWDAIPTSIKMVGKSKRNKVKIEPSYKVKDCPLFERG